MPEETPFISKQARAAQADRERHEDAQEAEHERKVGRFTHFMANGPSRPGDSGGWRERGEQSGGER